MTGEIKKKNNKKGFKTKEMKIKRLETKFDIKIIWIQTSRDEIENKIQLEKKGKKIIKRIRTKFNIKIKWY